MHLLFEHRSQPLISRRKFAHRLWKHFLIASAIVLVSLLIGMFGYHVLAHFSWLDSFLNASMLLGGMGPVGDIPTSSGKVFAGLYALYSGLLILVTAGVVLTPVLHRILHKFHWAQDR